jgi:non-specific serine/threonine protein kinase/protein-serine/threonine kinase
MGREIIESGTVIDGFLIGEKIHSGGMATLWRVTRPDIDVPIVMKVPTILDGDDATIIVGFEMEMMILPRLSGVHVPKCFAVGDFSQRPYVVLEYIQGYSVFGLIEKAPLPADEVASLGVKIATALVDLHRQNVLHLDIKPSNIMIRDSGEAALIDFGLSRHLFLPDLLEEEFRVPMGTGPYIAPEQIMKNRTDPRSDIYSLGVLLYYLATNVRPFGIPQAQSQLRKRLWRDPVPPRRLVPDMPEWLQEIILHCLEVDPEKRYGSAAQLAFDLANPLQVPLTERAEKLQRDSYLKSLKRWFANAGREATPQQPRQVQQNLAPIIMVAVDLSDGMEALSEELRVNVKRVLATMPGVRIACVNVLKLNRLTINYTLDEEGRNIHVQRLVELKEWARPLGLTQERITFHVLEHMDAAVALIEYARMNHVDQVLIGARTSSTLRRFLGSVSSQVVAEASCTVTVVRVPQGGELPEASNEPVIAGA